MMRRGFIYYRYRGQDAPLLSEYLDLVIRFALGFQIPGRFFIGILISRKLPDNESARRAGD